MMDLRFVASSTMKAEVVFLFAMSVGTYLFVWPFNNFGGDLLTLCRCEECIRRCRCCCCKDKGNQPKTGVAGDVSPNIGLTIAFAMLTTMMVMIAQTIYMHYAAAGHSWERNSILFMVIGLGTGLVIAALFRFFVWIITLLSGAALLYIISIYADDTGSLNNVIVLVGIFLTLGLLVLMRTCLQDFFVTLVLTIVSSFVNVYSVYYFQQRDFAEYTDATNDLLGISSCWQDYSGCLKRLAISAAFICIKLIVIAVTYSMKAVHCCCCNGNSDKEKERRRKREQRRRQLLLLQQQQQQPQQNQLMNQPPLPPLAPHQQQQHLMLQAAAPAAAGIHPLPLPPGVQPPLQQQQPPRQGAAVRYAALHNESSSSDDDDDDDGGGGDGL